MIEFILAYSYELTAFLLALWLVILLKLIFLYDEEHYAKIEAEKEEKLRKVVLKRLEDL